MRSNVQLQKWKNKCGKSQYVEPNAPGVKRRKFKLRQSSNPKTETSHKTDLVDLFSYTHIYIYTFIYFSFSYYQSAKSLLFM